MSTEIPMPFCYCCSCLPAAEAEQQRVRHPRESAQSSHLRCSALAFDLFALTTTAAVEVFTYGGGVMLASNFKIKTRHSFSDLHMRARRAGHAPRSTNR